MGVAVFTTPLFVMPLARIAGSFPPADNALYLPALLVGYGVAGVGAAAVFVASGSMLADVVDELEVTTGQRLAGVLFGASALSFKVTSGLGGFLGGLVLAAIAFPATMTPADVPAATVNWLGVGYGPGAAVLAAVALVWFSRYAITRTSHAALVRALDAQRTDDGWRPERGNLSPGDGRRGP